MVQPFILINRNKVKKALSLASKWMKPPDDTPERMEEYLEDLKVVEEVLNG